MNEKFFSLPEEKQLAIINAGYRVFSQNSDKNEVMNDLIWDKIEGYLISFTSSLTLKELVNSYKQYVSENEQELMYYI